MKEYLAEVFKKFVPLSGSNIPIGDNIDKVIDSLLSNKNFICVIKKGKGVIIGMVYPCYWNPDVLMAQEFGWWVEPEYRNTSLGIKLLNKFEDTAKEMGAKHISMIALESSSPDKVGSIYTKKGYTLLEHTYMKEL